MGLFDGAGGRGRRPPISPRRSAGRSCWCSTCKGQIETAAAVAAGCASFRDDVGIAGVILNRVASARHLAMIAPAFERVGIKLFGGLANDPRFALPERHLGLVQAIETADLEPRLDSIADALAQASVELDAIRHSARPAKLGRPGDGRRLRPPGQRIAVARDRAFSFLYPHLLDQWRRAGAEILPFSPLADEAPDPARRCDLAARRLSRAACRHARRGIAASSAGCGGRRRARSRSTASAAATWCWGRGSRMPTAGATPWRGCSSSRRRSRSAACISATAAHASRSIVRLGRAGNEIMGHEFHYARTLSIGDEPLVDCRDVSGARRARSGCAPRLGERHVLPRHQHEACHDRVAPALRSRPSARPSATSCCGGATCAASAPIRYRTSCSTT